MKPEAQPAGAPRELVRPGAITALLQELAAPSGPVPDEEPLPELEAGEQIGRFTIQRELGRGGFGVVYEARDGALGRSVAFKVVRTGVRNDLRESSLLAEAEAAARLSHPNIVTLFDVGRCAHGPYLVLELLRGEPLSVRLARGPLPVDEALPIAIGVARGLGHAHARGVVHRDLTPGNVFVCEDGGVKVLDFGLAHAFGRTRISGGTPAYVAPEQWRGAPEDERADVYALGVILYRMLSGELPFADPDDHEHAKPPPGLDVAGAPELGPLVARMLSRDPVHRPRDGAAVLALLEEIQRTLSDTPGPVRLRRAPRRPWWAAAAAAALVAVLAGGWWLRRAAAPEAAGGPAARVTVAVGDLANLTGEPDLDAVSGLLVTSLEQSRRLDVLPRTRLLDLLHVATPGGPEKLDARAGPEIARLAGADAFLLTTIYRFETVYVAELRAVDPGSGRTLFSMKEQERTKARIPELLDRISERVRLALREDAREIAADSVRLGAVTPSLEAWRHYFRGTECFERGQFAGSFEPCLAELKSAVALDPSFALAHLQIAQLSFMQGLPRSVQQAALAPALANEDRIPPRDRLRIRGWAAYLDGNDVEAKALFRRAANEAKDDKLVWWIAGEIPFHRDELAEAVPFLQRVHALDPTWLDANEHLAYALGATGRRDEVRALAADLARLAPNPAALTALCYAELWAEPERAIPACERAIAAGAGASGEQFLAIALLARGERDRLEEHLRAMTRTEPKLGFGWFMTLLLRAQQGRWPEVTRLAAAAGDPDYSWFHSTYAEALTGAGDAAGAWREAERTVALDPSVASGLAVHLAYLGDLAHAAELERYLQPGSPREATYRAVVRWRRGDRDGAIEQLRQIAARSPLAGDPPTPAPLFLLGEALSEAGRDAEAAEALRRFGAMPLHYPSWQYPRSLYDLAVSQERSGDLDAARETATALLRLWSDASPRQPLLPEARALGARLGVR